MTSGFDHIITEAQKVRDQIPPDIRANYNPNWRPGPEHKAAALAMLCDVLVKQLNGNAMLQPLTVTHELRPTGFTISVDMPAPTAHTDLELP